MSNPNTPDAAMLATLTDEEREAIADAAPDELNSHKAAPADEPDDADDTADAADDGPDDEAEAVAGATAAEASSGPASDDAKVDAAAAPAPAPRAHHQAAVNALFATALQPSGGGIDYNKDQEKRADLDAFVRALAANEKNNDKPLAWFLNEAHTRVMALHGIARKEPSKDDLVAAANARRKPDLTPTRQSLANIPGGEGSNPVGSEFDDVLALEGEAYEAAIEKMARSAPERFARFQGMTQ